MLLCDLDDGNVDAQETLQFSVGNTCYEMDVCARHARQIRHGLQPFVEHARKASSANGARRRSRTASSRQQTSDIRMWAKGQGIQVNDRGRIPANVVKEYEAAH